MDYIKLHEQIDVFIQKGSSAASRADFENLIAKSEDARSYFYSHLDETWFDFLLNNGVFDILKRKSLDASTYSYRTAELNYIANIAEKIPQKVVDLMLTVPITSENFNPEVVDRFLWIASKLPAEQLRQIVTKLRDEQWVSLMAPFNKWIFEYQKMFETLEKANDQGGILILAEAVLAVRSKEEVDKAGKGFSTENLFYLTDLSETGVFNLLASIHDKHVEEAFRITTDALAKVILTGDREDSVFEIGELFHLFDVDFFSLELGKGRHYSHRDEIRELAAVVKVLAERGIGHHCDDAKAARKLYEKYIVPLPDSRSMWRLRLYIWSLCPKVFTKELRDAFFRGLQSRDTLWPITGGAEYDHALKKCFGFLSEVDRKAYIARAFELLDVKEEHPYGYGIFASIQEFLGDAKARAEKIYGIPLDPAYTPQPSVGRSRGGTIVPQAPESVDDVWKRSVPEIVEVLKTEWTPQQVRELDKNQDFLRPVNAEGVADKMRTQMKTRTHEYTSNAVLFFDRSALDAHYTYSFFRGIDEIVRMHRDRVPEIDWQQVINLGLAITTEGEREPFDFSKREREHFDTWLAGWMGVHDGLGDVLQDYLRNENGLTDETFVKNRDNVFKIIRYLLTVPDPIPKDEQPETAGMTTTPPGGEKLVSDPFSIAINSVRGRAYQAFVLFMEWDGKKFPKEAKMKLSSDVLEEYTNLLAREDTGAIFFMYGHYLPFFYFRDAADIRRLFPQIFTTDSSKTHLYLAAWEGYLTRSLYREMFDELQGEYDRAIRNTADSYPKRNYRADLDEALATHLALAYMHFDDFTLDSKLFRLFWDTPDKKRHSEFVAFIGRYVISRDHPKVFLTENPEINIQKLIKFWDWSLEHIDDPEVFAEYGFWMNSADGLYDDIPAFAQRIKSTLEKSNGRIDWEIKFIDSLPILAAEAPVDTVEILRLYLTPLDMSPRNRYFMHVDKDLVEVFRILYQNPKTKDATYKLIDDLLPLGNGTYWKLKEALT